jgi:hypothetical protein
VLSADDRFIRTSKSRWALRVWGHDEYGGIAGELGARIDAAGGWLTVEDLIADVLASVPDVTEASVKAYLHRALAFVVESGMVRRRNENDLLPAPAPLRSVRGAYLSGDEIRFAVPVTADVLRGSGMAIPAALAAALGVSPGQQRDFDCPFGQVSVIWRLASSVGPYVGSLRALARGVAAEEADTLVLGFDPEQGALRVSRVDAGTAGIVLLRGLLGRAVRLPAAALSASLQCRRGDVIEVLRARGDHEVADFVESQGD